MVKMSNLPDDTGEGRAITGAEGEVTAQQPTGEPAEAAGERSQERPEAQAPAPETAAETPRDRAKLAFASFLMLFVELAMIRWVTANNVYVN